MPLEMAESDVIIERMEDQIRWYDRKGSANQRTFKSIKTIEIIFAALIPFVPVFKDYLPVAWVTGTLGVLITVLEGLLHLHQYQQNWITYRSTCEALKHEKYLFLGNAPPYAGNADPRAMLAERVESLVSQEHAKWTTTQSQSAKPKS